MKVIEVMRLSREILDVLQNSCIKVEDVRYLPMYEDYEQMMKDGGKKAYVIATLVDIYHISERQAYYVIKKFSQDCK